MSFDFRPGIITRPKHQHRLSERVVRAKSMSPTYIMSEYLVERVNEEREETGDDKASEGS